VWKYNDIIHCSFSKRDDGDDSGYLPNELEIIDSKTHIVEIDSEPARLPLAGCHS
jgi:hypothetical protein